MPAQTPRRRLAVTIRVVRENAPMAATMTGTRIRYMGNKVALSGRVASLVAAMPPDRPLVDLFSGMCSVAGAVAPSGRRVMVNDIQQYARLVASCLITASGPPPTPSVAAEALWLGYDDNLAALTDRFDAALREERHILESPSAEAYHRVQRAWRHIGNDDALASEAQRQREHPEGPRRVATLTFAWGYFGLRQAIELDSLRAGIDVATSRGVLTASQAAWCRLALLQVASRVASTPGHFAQFLRGNSPAAMSRVIRSRRRSVRTGFFEDLAVLRPFGTVAWRRRNHVLTLDAVQLWPALDAVVPDPAIFYADPPYSKEHYSRFYHVLETLERYDYPPAEGLGRYRPDRFATPLGTRRGVVPSLNAICSQIAARDGCLLLSYPSSGLLTRDLGVDPYDLLATHFRDVELAICEEHLHSTLGARHGDAQRQVTEYVWIAQ
ncbi:MAG TPA: DNA adenine methylase [Solirubrobacteraceae bacterium]